MKLIKCPLKNCSDGIQVDEDLEKTYESLKRHIDIRHTCIQHQEIFEDLLVDYIQREVAKLGRSKD